MTDNAKQTTPEPEAAETPSEYLRGVEWGKFTRDGEVSLLNAVIREKDAEIKKLRAALRQIGAVRPLNWAASYDPLQRDAWLAVDAALKGDSNGA